MRTPASSARSGRVLGISCHFHDAAACLVEDGRIVAAAEEERFSRRKHDPDIPVNAIRWCLAEAGARPGKPLALDAVAYYDKPILKLHRLLETYLARAPRGLSIFTRAVPAFFRDKLLVEPALLAAVERTGGIPPERLHFAGHHESHAASTFFPSPFDEAAILTVDGVGEWASSTLGIGQGGRLQILKEQCFPHSLGLLYSAFTHHAGFKVNSGEYKLMGLAPYGEPRYVNRILEQVIDLKSDGSFQLNTRYVGFLDGDRMTSPQFDRLFDGPARIPESAITRRECDLARSIQEVTELVLLRMARHARQLTGMRRLCLAGGVALNCVANGKLLRSGLFDDVWIQPAAGDSGGALGAALAVWHGDGKQPRRIVRGRDGMQGALLGPAFPDDAIRRFLELRGYPYSELPEHDRSDRLAGLLRDGSIVAVLDGRMEFGPRALGNRSILADARSPRMQSLLNQSIKMREGFRPFAPAVLEERAAEWFDLDRPSPYMLVVAGIAARHRVAMEDGIPAAEQGSTADESTADESTADVVAAEKRGGSPPSVGLDLSGMASRVRSTIPAVTHVDYTARVQTVSPRSNPRFHALLSAFERLTGCPVLVNTSFNLRGEPMVCTPEDAYRCFMRSKIDYLVLGSFLLDRRDQPPWPEDDSWQEAPLLD